MNYRERVELDRHITRGPPEPRARAPGATLPAIAPYAERVRELEELEEMSTSDAQACVDAERVNFALVSGLELIGRATRGSFYLWSLAGAHHARERAAIASALAGSRIPQAGAGVTALERYLMALAPIAGDCLAVRQDALAAWCRAIVSQHSTIGRIQS